RPGEELHGLHDELDLADAAPPELDVGDLATLGAKGAVDLPLHRAHGRDDALVEARTIDHLARQILKARADPRVARGNPRLDERLALPQLGALPVVLAIAVERQHDRAHAPFRSDPQIDSEDVALLGDVLQQRDQLATDTREVVAVGDAPASTSRRLTVRAVDEHQIDVGRTVQINPAELA